MAYIIKKQIIEILRKKFGNVVRDIIFGKEANINFVIKNPGICTDYVDNTNGSIYSHPDRNIVPCITKIMNTEISLCTCKSGHYSIRACTCNYNKHKVSSNFMLESSYKTSFKTIFGEHIRLLKACPTHGFFCAVAHFKEFIIVNENDRQVRKTFNEKTLKYADLLVLWHKYYDDNMERLHQIENDVLELKYSELTYRDCASLLFTNIVDYTDYKNYNCTDYKWIRNIHKYLEKVDKNINKQNT
jgi:hypothetical protein